MILVSISLGLACQSCQTFGCQVSLGISQVFKHCPTAIRDLSQA